MLEFCTPRKETKDTGTVPASSSTTMTKENTIKNLLRIDKNTIIQERLTTLEADRAKVKSLRFQKTQSEATKALKT